MHSMNKDLFEDWVAFMRIWTLRWRMWSIVHVQFWKSFLWFWWWRNMNCRVSTFTRKICIESATELGNDKGGHWCNHCSKLPKWLDIHRQHVEWKAKKGWHVSLVPMHMCHRLGWQKPKLDNMVCGVWWWDCHYCTPIVLNHFKNNGWTWWGGRHGDWHAHITFFLHININYVTKVQVLQW